MEQKTYPLRFFSLVLAILCLPFQHTYAQEKESIESFQVSIINAEYLSNYSVNIYLTNKDLKVILKSKLMESNDTTLFYTTLPYSDTLKAIGKTKLDTLKTHYSNPCMDDGSELTIILKKNKHSKTIHLSNFYQEEIGKIIYLVNALLPKKSQVLYNKEKLIADYKRCKGIQ